MSQTPSPLLDMPEHVGVENPVWDWFLAHHRLPPPCLGRFWRIMLKVVIGF